MTLNNLKNIPDLPFPADTEIEWQQVDNLISAILYELGVDTGAVTYAEFENGAELLDAYNNAAQGADMLAAKVEDTNDDYLRKEAVLAANRAKILARRLHLNIILQTIRERKEA